MKIKSSVARGQTGSTPGDIQKGAAKWGRYQKNGCDSLKNVGEKAKMGVIKGATGISRLSGAAKLQSIPGADGDNPHYTTGDKAGLSSLHRQRHCPNNVVN